MEQLLERARALEPIQFSELMDVIEQYYEFTPTAFRNGELSNSEDQNQGSCKLLAFALQHQLSVEQTLNLFGDYYHQEVLGDPQGSAHGNIRAFMRSGWEGVSFAAEPLRLRA
ncbi:HopJ type III effector protein [Motiliproteus coralliicola]|uniref:HopJ type III effector protein n=1 Tax=Motiliproteus coralliicola TaxID=2283196 RepID=UPI003C7365E2